MRSAAMLGIQEEKTAQRIAGWLRRRFREAGRRTAVVGLSGGVDSSTVAALCARALGPRRVLGVLLPYETSSPQSLADGREVIRRFGLRSARVDVSAMVRAYFGKSSPPPVRLGNYCARQRMAALYDLAARENGLVVGTSNRTELLLGYFTKFGDGGVDLEPIAGLYKCQVRRLASHLGVPERIVVKKPTADLWPGQTDEDEMRLSYDEADAILHLLFDRRQSPERIRRAGFPASKIRRVLSLWKAGRHKCEPPPSGPPPVRA